MTSVLSVRHFNPARDTREVEALEKICDAPSGGISITSDFMGDPLARVRHFPAYAMLVAELDGQIVGVIRIGIKDMVCGTSKSRSKDSPIFQKSAYILGLRVSPFKRRMGIAMALASRAECWCVEQGASYAYMATEKSNEASVNLFTKRLGFLPCRSPSLLVHPIFQHDEPVGSAARITPLRPEIAAELYRLFLGRRDFFPAEIDTILASKRCAGTWIATLRSADDPMAAAVGTAANSWAILSLWRCNEIFKLQVGGARRRLRALAAASRAIDRAAPWLRLNSFPNVFRPFGMQFMFGMHAQGDRGGELLDRLCRHARNVARSEGCSVVVAELGGDDPLRRFVPHWRSMSSCDDLWCVKDLKNSSSSRSIDGQLQKNWIHAPMGSPLFVDPRDV